MPGAAGGIIVTGFGPFPGVPDNPTQRLVEHLRAYPPLLPGDARCELLDVDYRAVDAAIAQLVGASPAVLLLTGYSARASGITLESRATSACAANLPDMRGHVAPSRESPAMTSTLDLKALAAMLQDEGLPADVSCDAGQYLCNFAYRRALEEIAVNGGGTQALFVHLPALAGTPAANSSAGAMPLADMARGVATIAHWLADRASIGHGKAVSV